MGKSRSPEVKSSRAWFWPQLYLVVLEHMHHAEFHDKRGVESPWTTMHVSMNLLQAYYGANVKWETGG